MDFFFKDRLESQISLAEETNRWNVQRQEKYLRFKERVLKSVEPKRSLHASCTETCGVVMCSLTSKGIQFCRPSCFLWESGTRYCNEPVIRWFPTGIFRCLSNYISIRKGMERPTADLPVILSFGTFEYV